MAVLRFKIDSSEMVKAFERLSEGTENLRPLLREAGAKAMQMIARRFAQQGPGWAPLAPSTIARRRGSGRSVQILRDTGRLLNSTQGGQGHVYQMRRRGLVIGTNLVYARTHQMGRGNIPARPFLPEEAKLARAIERIAKRYVDEISS